MGKVILAKATSEDNIKVIEEMLQNVNINFHNDNNELFLIPVPDIEDKVRFEEVLLKAKEMLVTGLKLPIEWDTFSLSYTEENQDKYSKLSTTSEKEEHNLQLIEKVEIDSSEEIRKKHLVQEYEEKIKGAVNLKQGDKIELIEKIADLSVEYCFSPLQIQHLKDIIITKLKFPKNVINSTFKISEQKEGTESISEFTSEPKYQLEEYDYGYRFTMPHPQYKTRTEIADFNKIEKQKCEVYDIASNETHFRYRYSISYKDKRTLVRNDEDLKYILSQAKRAPVFATWINSETEISFINQLKQLPEQTVKLTNAFGFYNNKYQDYPEYNAYTVLWRKEGGKMVKEEMDKLPSTDYLDFLKIKPEEDKIKGCLEILNTNYCRSDAEKIILKVIGSFSVSSVLKVVLYRAGIKLHPLMVVIGSAGTGKSTNCRIFTRHLWHTSELSKQDFEGVKGARIKRVNPDLFPKYIDEINTFKGLTEELKQSTTGVGINIIKGDKSESVYTHVVYNNLVSSTNEYRIEDAHFKNKHLILKYPLTKSKGDSKQVDYLNENIIHIGKKIYDSFRNCDFSQIVKDLKSKYQEKEYLPRQMDKLIYIKLGEIILDDIGLWNDVEIPEELILNEDIEGLADTKDLILMAIRDLIANCSYRDKDGKIWTVPRVLEENYMDENIYRFFESKGVFIDYSFNHVIVGKNALKTITEYLNRMKMSTIISRLPQLAELLNIPYKSEHPQNVIMATLEVHDSKGTVRCDKTKTSKYGVPIFSRENILEGEVVYVNSNKQNKLL